MVAGRVGGDLISIGHLEPDEDSREASVKRVGPKRPGQRLALGRAKWIGTETRKEAHRDSGRLAARQNRPLIAHPVPVVHISLLD